MEGQRKVIKSLEITDGDKTLYEDSNDEPSFDTAYNIEVLNMVFYQFFYRKRRV